MILHPVNDALSVLLLSSNRFSANVKNTCRKLSLTGNVKNTIPVSFICSKLEHIFKGINFSERKECNILFFFSGK